MPDQEIKKVRIPIRKNIRLSNNEHTEKDVTETFDFSKLDVSNGPSAAIDAENESVSANAVVEDLFTGIPVEAVDTEVEDVFEAIQEKMDEQFEKSAETTEENEMVNEPETTEEQTSYTFDELVNNVEKRYQRNNPGFIQMTDVKKTYVMGETEIKALDGVDFSIDEGEFVIIVGASGAGKSTILNILGGMDKATSGRMVVDGNEISSYNKKQMTLYRRYDVGFVFQSYNLVQNLTARENVELAVQVSQNPLDVDETIKAVGLEDRKKNFPSQLSGGEQQRIAIARALAKNPKMLLCDEPTGALDYSTGKSILKLLQDTARSNNMTVIIVTHNAALTCIGDKVIRVKSGKIESVTLNENPMDIADIEW